MRKFFGSNFEENQAKSRQQGRHYNGVRVRLQPRGKPTVLLTVVDLYNRLSPCCRCRASTARGNTWAAFGSIHRICGACFRVICEAADHGHSCQSRIPVRNEPKASHTKKKSPVGLYRASPRSCARCLCHPRRVQPSACSAVCNLSPSDCTS